MPSYFLQVIVVKVLVSIVLLIAAVTTVRVGKAALNRGRVWQQGLSSLFAVFLQC